MQPWNCSRRQINRSFTCFALAALFFCGSVSAEMRIWEDTSGVQVKAEFERELFGSVELRRPDGSRHSIPLEKLSAQDIKYIRTRLPPKIKLDVRATNRSKVRNTHTLADPDWDSFDDEIDVVEIKTQIKKKSMAAFDGILRAEVYLIGREVLTPEIYRLSGKGASSQVKFTEENKGTFTFLGSADFRVYQEYNQMETRGAEYEGYLVIVTDSMGKKMATATNLSWLEDEKKMDELRNFYVGSFFNKDCRKQPVPRPAYFTSQRENF